MGAEDQRFDVLFEAVRIGPVVAPNRFYQVPHCTGMGYALPQTLAAMREIKAEGGWGVVNTEYCSIHETSDSAPLHSARLWDEGDVRNMALMVDKVHGHGALAGVELWHSGMRTPNALTRRPQIGPMSMPVSAAPLQCRAMDKADIADYRGWHKAAAQRAKQAGYDIVYVYAAHGYLLDQFLDPRLNRRQDAYGGSLANRVRLLREVLEDTKEAVGESCAVALRIAAGGVGSDDSEQAAIIGSIGDLPDLFDVTVQDYGHEMGVSRFVKEASLEEHVGYVRELTGKPVVGVGRFTSPETMLSQVRRGVLDLIGAARPSIADPFLPTKIREGRLEDIRECIGCNICYATDMQSAPIRCTQNPTMGEEWRRGWHPERVPAAKSTDPVLIVGGGPAGLEAAHILGKRGYPVMLAEQSGELGGRVTRESALPGLAEWARVRDYRLQQISSLANVEVYLASSMSAEDVLSTEAPHVFIATGSQWRRDGRGRTHSAAVDSFDAPTTLTPDDIMAGKRPQGPVVVYDDDCYYMASVLCELLAGEGYDVTYVTPDPTVSSWSRNTYDHPRIQARLIELGVRLDLGQAVVELGEGMVFLSCVYSGRIIERRCGGFIPVTSREPNNALWRALTRLRERDESHLRTLRRIGDSNVPGIIAMAVYDGHKAARDFDADPRGAKVRRETMPVTGGQAD